MYNISDVASSLEIPLHRAEELVGMGVFKAEEDGGFNLPRSRRRWRLYTALDRPTLSEEVERERTIAGVLLQRLDEASIEALPAALREVAEAIRRVTDALEIGVARVPAHARPAAKALADEVAVSFGHEMLAVADAAVRGALDRERRRLRGDPNFDATDLDGGCGMSGMCAFRACCPRGARSGSRTGVTIPIDPVAREAADATAWPISVGAPILVEEMPVPPPSKEIAFHESGHVVAAHAVGLPVQGVTIGVGASMSLGAAVVGWRARAFVSAAGPVAQEWMTRNIVRNSEAAILWHLQAVRDLDFGNCDFCQMMLQIIGGNKGVNDAGAIDIYRKIDDATINWVRRGAVWSSITRISEALMARIDLSGDDVVSLIGPEPIPAPKFGD